MKAGEDYRRYDVDSMDQETSQSLISLPQTQDPDLSAASSSQGIVSHFDEYGFRSTGD